MEMEKNSIETKQNKRKNRNVHTHTHSLRPINEGTNERTNENEYIKEKHGLRMNTCLLRFADRGTRTN